MTTAKQPDLVHDLFLPTLLFAALGAMTWAVRGCTGFGGSAGCIFAGVGWGTAWWFIAHDPGSDQSRRYASGWIVLAVTVGVGLSGARGWMQWPSFFEGRLQTNYAAGEYVPISRVYGFVWLFIAGVPWAGIGACLLAWCGSLRETRVWHWLLRIGLGIGGAALVVTLYRAYPQYFLPLYESMETRYHDVEHNPNLRRLTNDCRLALMHLGLYAGLLCYEVIRRDWKNVVLILTVGVLNGVGWSLCQNWTWAAHFWSGAGSNWWRCWESSGGISIGIAYGVAYFLVNRRMSGRERAIVASRRSISGPNLEWLIVYLGLTALVGVPMIVEISAWGLLLLGILMLFGIAYWFLYRGVKVSELPTRGYAYGDPTLERFGLYLGLLIGLGFSVRNGMKGWFNIYYGREEYWGTILWQIVGPILLLGLLALCAWALWRPLPKNIDRDVFPHSHWVMWFALIFLNLIAQIVTGPPWQWNEFTFSIYYVLLFLITAVIVVHYSELKQRPARDPARMVARN